MRKRPYENIIAWKESYSLCLDIYKLTKSFPNDERFALTNQIRRASSSVPINIAEGNMKRSRKEKARFFEIAQASLEEVHCEMRLSYDLKYISEEQFTALDKQLNKSSYLPSRLHASVSSDS